MSQQKSLPLRTCDIVMKGGITSGVVYPSAIASLSRRFVFKNIGGTSAGAIAAAGAAAAEFRRASGGGGAGFDQLAKLPTFLGEKPDGSKRTRLFHFFQPDARTRRIFNVLTSALGGGAKAGVVLVLQILKNYVGYALTGALPGFVLGTWSLLNRTAGPIAWVWVAISAVLFLVGALASAAAGFALNCIREIPRNNFGLCSGLSDPTRTCANAPEALTTWLKRYLNETAGLPPDGPPLTFGQLWGTQESDQEIAPRRVNLEMMTTNLTHGRPYRLPFRDDADLKENGQFYFRPEEFRQLFPESVVRWMLDHPRDGEPSAERQVERERLRNQGFHPLPEPANLPVVVATRMSLSFPILLCAVPLHAVDRGPFPKNEQPERCWFSDGGMCSNFPIHFFDTALPRRPTFSIDLTQKPEHTPPEKLQPEMPTKNAAGVSERWNRFDTEFPMRSDQIPAEKAALQRLLGFCGAIIATMQNWTDATQSRLPGYRDRIVRVPLTPQEGGLNLDMPPERIAALSERGELAARDLVKHFDVPASEETMTWDNHRWIRLRSFLASLEKSLSQLVTACEKPENGDRCYPQWLNDLAGDGPSGKAAKAKKAPSYDMSRRQLEAARKALQSLQAIHQLWSNSPVAENAPRPRPVLRPRAQI